MVHGVVYVLTAFKLLQFVDRSVSSGAPLEFGAFIFRTLGETSDQAALFGSLSTVYTAGTLVGCVCAVVARLAGVGAQRLLGGSMCLWLVGVFCAGLVYWGPDDGATFLSYGAARLLAGFGAGCVTVTWPPHVEEVAPAHERSLSMALVETGTALGAALGVAYSAATATALGWGWSYLLVACAGLGLVAPMLGPTFRRAPAAPAAPASRAVPTALDAGLGRLVAAPPLACFLAGIVFASGGTQAIVVFFPTLAFELGLAANEVSVALQFGACILFGALVGGPSLGVLAERVAPPRADAPAAQAATLLRLCTAAQAAGGALIVATAGGAWAGSAAAVNALVALASLGLIGSLGLQVRLPLLLCAPGARPLAVLAGTAAGYVGEALGPLGIGALKDRLASRCAVVGAGAANADAANADAAADAAADADAAAAVDAGCAAAAEQRGLLLVVAGLGVLALLAAALWGAAERAARTRGRKHGELF